MCEEGKNRVRKETEETETVSQLTRQREILHCVERMEDDRTDTNNDCAHSLLCSGEAQQGKSYATFCLENRRSHSSVCTFDKKVK